MPSLKIKIINVPSRERHRCCEDDAVAVDFQLTGFSGGECSGAFSSAFFQATQVQPQMDGVNAHKEIFKF